MFKKLMAKSAENKNGLSKCPRCSRTPTIEYRDVEPQADPWFSGKTIFFVECECGLALFNGKLHEGFQNPSAAADAWNKPSLNANSADEAGLICEQPNN